MVSYKLHLDIPMIHCINVFYISMVYTFTLKKKQMPDPSFLCLSFDTRSCECQLFSLAHIVIDLLLPSPLHVMFSTSAKYSIREKTQFVSASKYNSLKKKWNRKEEASVRQNERERRRGEKDSVNWYSCFSFVFIYV
jgi:hypothetical protein